MRVPGWCEVCKRPKTVRVTAAGMLSVALQGVAVGVCAECEDSGR